MIYFDGVHMMATDIDELHAEATRIGLKPEWAQEKHGRIHYDVWGQPAQRLTVKQCTTREMLEACNQRGRDGVLSHER